MLEVLLFYVLSLRRYRDKEIWIIGWGLMVIKIQQIRLQLNNFYQQIQELKMQSHIDYRNSKYQGQIDSKELRNGYGILIDDDLSLYSSNWLQGKLNDSTVIYISHGKYIYGQWENNQPHGLNVFRIGDTVVLGEFQSGYLVKKAIVIFQKLNFVALLEEKRDGSWGVWKRGILKSYNQLVAYIQQAGIAMKPQYFSLTKFLTFISNSRAAAVPCQGSENCYYGYQQGLGITFNPNNGVVSVGYHQNKKLSQFGGKFEHPNFVIQGNFQTNQLVKYSSQRPKQQIYSIYQKMHKRSLTFKNQYFDSKVKLLTHVEELIRSKIDQIMDMGDCVEQENTFTALDLNDSLDYHAESLEQMNKINKIRQQVYENIHIPMKKATSQYVQNSPQPSSKKVSYMTPVKKKMQLITNAPASPITMKKSPLKKQKQKEKQMEREKERQKQKQKQKQKQRQKQRQRQRERERSRIKQKQKERQMIRTPSKRGNLMKTETNQYKQHTFANIEEPLEKQQQFRQLARTPTRTNLSKQEFQYKEGQNSRSNIPEKPTLRQLSSQAESHVSGSSASIKRPISQIHGKSPYESKYQNLNSGYSKTSHNIESPLGNNNISNPFSYTKSYELKQDQAFKSEQEPNSPIDQILVSSKNYLREKEMYNVPSFKYSCSEFDKNQNTNTAVKSRVNLEAKLTASQRVERVQRNQRAQRIENVDWIDSCSSQSRHSVSPINNPRKQGDARQLQLSKSPIKGPNYQNLSERRRRLLKQFKNLNQGQETAMPSALLSKILPPPPTFSKISSLTIPQPSFPSNTSFYPQQSKKQTQRPNKFQIEEIESPCARQKFPSYQSKNTEQQSETMMPLTICKSSNDLQMDWRKRQQEVNEKSDKNEKDIKINGTRLSSKENRMQEYRIERAYIDRSYKQNQDTEIKLSSRPFQKKDSYYEKAGQGQRQPQKQVSKPLQRQEKTTERENSMTPNRRKAYKYYFDE